MTEKHNWQEFLDAHAPICEENAFTRNTLAEASRADRAAGVHVEWVPADLGPAARPAVPWDQPRSRRRREEP